MKVLSSLLFNEMCKFKPEPCEEQKHVLEDSKPMSAWLRSAWIEALGQI